MAPARWHRVVPSKPSASIQSHPETMWVARKTPTDHLPFTPPICEGNGAEGTRERTLRSVVFCRNSGHVVVDESCPFAGRRSSNMCPVCLSVCLSVSPPRRVSTGGFASSPLQISDPDLGPSALEGKDRTSRKNNTKKCQKRQSQDSRPQAKRTEKVSNIRGMNDCEVDLSS